MKNKFTKSILLLFTMFILTNLIHAQCGVDPDEIFCDDFESGTANWTLEGTWGTTTAQSNGGMNSLTDSPAGNYAANSTISATMATGVDLTTALDANLYFDAIYDIEGGNFDFVYVEASTDGGSSWTNIATFLGQDNLTPWITYNYSLGGFVGNSDVRIRFRLSSDGGLEVDGIYIDNFYITASDEDNAAPLILHTPVEYYESQLGDITKTAEIIDISSLATVELFYDVDGVFQSAIAGTDLGSNMWSFVIPEQEAGAQVDYFIAATDNSANSNSAVTNIYSYIAGNHIFYDNGQVDFIANVGPTGSNGNAAAAVRITIDGTTNIAYALIRNQTQQTNPANSDIEVHVWADNNGVPGADLIAPVTVTPEATLQNSSPMTRVDLRPFAAQLTDTYGDVFVGYTVPVGECWTTQTTPGTGNRTFLTTDGVTWTLDTDDFHFRLVTSEIVSPVNVTFNVNLNDGIIVPDPAGAHISGDMNNDTPEAMTDNGDGSYTATYSLLPGTTVEYKFANGATALEDNIPSTCTNAMGNRFVIVGDTDMNVDMVCLNLCADCTVGTEDLAFANAISIYPNPTKDISNIVYNFETSTDLTIRLSNNLGQTISSDVVENAQNGSHQLSLNKLSAGVYYVYITNGAQSMIEKLVVR